MFHFHGPLDISKSWMNRALILHSFKPSLKISGSSNADDVVLLKKALHNLQKGHYEFDAGLGGTTFRFLAFRVSREAGNFLIRAHPRLLARPQDELIHILQQLGVQAMFTPEGLRISSSGWKQPSRAIEVSGRDSSQFISGVLLSTVGLPFNLELTVKDQVTSLGYIEYTIALLNTAGVQVQPKKHNFSVSAEQKILADHLEGEIDVSSAFSLIAASVLAGECNLANWMAGSLQPDMKFKDFFKSMRIDFSEKDLHFKISMQNHYLALKADLQNCPDLFPVLSVLAAFADGESHLYGAPQLKMKESDRIAKTTELLSRCGFQVEALNDGIKINGNPKATYKAKDFILFDAAHDHRMAMAAALLMLKGFPIRMSDPHVVSKSFPQFYQAIGLQI